jgi:aspartate ammonia-lyase
MRIEKDKMGSCEIPKDALYGINAVRAQANFPNSAPFHKVWYKAMGTVKEACYLTYEKYAVALHQKYGEKIPISLIDSKIITELKNAATHVAQGKHYEHFIVPAMQGGAGTSINMNINEIVTNVALKNTGKMPGEYHIIDPVEHANIFQSTNDTVPTALRVAAMQLFTKLETSINELRTAFEKAEQKYREAMRPAYTQLQEAVPTSYGKMFSAYSDALSRDWWRVSKCFERIKVVNLGGSAIGTGITVPTYFIMEVVQTLQRLTNLPVTRSENMMDTTSNLDVFVEIHATLKAHAVNLEKAAADIRLLASDLSKHNEITIPEKQTGSSIMPGKVNPVIAEFIISSAHKVYANDMLISSLCGQGQLELNAYLPTIGDALLNSLDLLIAANNTFQTNLLEGLQINRERATQRLYSSPSIATALIPYIGYHKAGDLAQKMKQNSITIFEANDELKAINKEKLEAILTPSNLLKTGFKPGDVDRDMH